MIQPQFKAFLDFKKRNATFQTGVTSSVSKKTVAQAGPANFSTSKNRNAMKPQLPDSAQTFPFLKSRVINLLQQHAK